MKFIISTHKSCFIYDHNKDIINDIERGTKGAQWAYGISWFKDKIFIGWRKPCEVLEYDTSFKFTGRKCQGSLGFRVGDVHQIICFDKKIWVTNTGSNSISIFDASTLELVEDWRPHKAIKEMDSPYVSKKNINKNKHPNYYKHYNSIFFDKKRIFINAHMTVNNPPSKVWVFLRKNRKFIKKIEGGISTHNLFLINNQITVCDSENSQIIQPETNKVLFRARVGSFLRGVSLPPKMVVIGSSGMQSIRNKRNNARGGIVIFNNTKFKNPDLKWFGRGPIQEIRCLDFYDKAHNNSVFLE